ncbi:hypothetical protein SISSUDRAFT_1042122 [Sistotremastrum suecicum HHB10207 ss-3]|uniref:AB hydrolase-1 domain-containing protein n=1 Tax=Sistotremastrum suecicum HHB10207 ss-3 TaxID=1314776 RepID=A0A166GQ72_9AGAM|nr:hypothetical protein SISSUDRAFT_1042122 [Sistotremastrum suecicum HHB10207 ss-3]
MIYEPTTGIFVSHSEVNLVHRSHTRPGPIQEYSKAAYTYLTGKPGGHDLSKRRLVLIGHSFGAVIIPFLTQMQPKIHFDSIILGDPVISPRGREKDLVGKFFMDGSISRKDIWTNREEAREYLDGNKTFKHWPSAMKRLFVVRITDFQLVQYDITRKPRITP